MFRQGDVLIVPVAEVPAGLKNVPLDGGRLVLAYGEATGHAHVVDGDAQLLESDVADMGERFLRVLEEDAALVHDEHDTIVLPPGDYAVIGQREYTPEAIRRVAD
jgi:hypothetical protein